VVSSNIPTYTIGVYYATVDMTGYWSSNTPAFADFSASPNTWYYYTPLVGGGTLSVSNLVVTEPCDTNNPNYVILWGKPILPNLLAGGQVGCWYRQIAKSPPTNPIITFNVSIPVNITTNNGTTNVYSNSTWFFRTTQDTNYAPSVVVDFQNAVNANNDQEGSSNYDATFPIFNPGTSSTYGILYDGVIQSGLIAARRYWTNFCGSYGAYDFDPSGITELIFSDNGIFDVTTDSFTINLTLSPEILGQGTTNIFLMGNGYPGLYGWYLIMNGGKLVLAMENPAGEYTATSGDVIFASQQDAGHGDRNWRLGSIVVSGSNVTFYSFDSMGLRVQTPTTYTGTYHGIAPVGANHGFSVFYDPDFPRFGQDGQSGHFDFTRGHAATLPELVTLYNQLFVAPVHMVGGRQLHGED
jgi:hypothetical protein